MFFPFSFGKSVEYPEFIIDAEVVGTSFNYAETQIGMSGDGSIISVGSLSNKKLYLMSGKDGSTLRVINAPDGSVSIFPVNSTVSSDGTTVLAGDRQYPPTLDGRVWAFNVSDGSLKTTIPNPNPSAIDGWGGYGIRLTSDGSIANIPAPYYIYTSGNYRGRVYQYTTNNPTSFVDSFGDNSDPGISNIGFAVSNDISGDGSIIAVGAYQYDETFTDQGGVYVYFKSLSGASKFVPSPSPGAFFNFGRNVAVSKDGTRLLVTEPGAFGGKGRVHIYDIEDIRDSFDPPPPLITINNPTTFGYGSMGAGACAISADGSVIASTTTANEIFTFDNSGTLIRRLTPDLLDPTFTEDGFGSGYCQSLVLTDNGKRIAILSSQYHPGSYNYLGGVFVFNL